MVEYRCLEAETLLESGVEHGGEDGEVLVDGLLHVAVVLHVEDKLVNQPLVDVFPVERVLFYECLEDVGKARISVKRLFRVVVALAFYRAVLHALQPLAHEVQHSRAACLLQLPDEFGVGGGLLLFLATMVVRLISAGFTDLTTSYTSRMSLRVRASSGRAIEMAVKEAMNASMSVFFSAVRHGMPH